MDLSIHSALRFLHLSGNCECGLCHRMLKLDCLEIQLPLLVDKQKILLSMLPSRLNLTNSILPIKNFVPPASEIAWLSELPCGSTIPPEVLTLPVTKTLINCGVKLDLPAFISCSRSTTGLFLIFNVSPSSRRIF